MSIYTRDSAESHLLGFLTAALFLVVHPFAAESIHALYGLLILAAAFIVIAVSEKTRGSMSIAGIAMATATGFGLAESSFVSGYEESPIAGTLLVACVAGLIGALVDLYLGKKQSRHGSDQSIFLSVLSHAAAGVIGFYAVIETFWAGWLWIAVAAYNGYICSVLPEGESVDPRPLEIDEHSFRLYLA